MTRKKPYDLYEDIFLCDPLLLTRRSQALYGKALLSHLLLYRVQKAYLPTEIDLNDEASRLDTKRRPPKCPGDDFITSNELAAYSKSVLRREEIVLDEASRNRIRCVSMMSDGDRTAERGKAFGYQSLAVEQTTPDGCLRIAAISHRVSISKLERRGLMSEELSFLDKQDDGQIATKILSGATAEDYKEIMRHNRLGRTIISNQLRPPDWLQEIKTKIDTSLARGAHVVFLPEFALPPDVAQQKQTVQSQLLSTCQDAVDSGRAPQSFLLFSGSRHDGPYNRGLVISRQTHTGGKISEPLWHYKLTSARALGENILGPGVSKIPSYALQLELPGASKRIEFRVLIPICYDVFDPSVLISLAAKCNYDSGTVPIILVPSFNPSRDFVALLRDLSFLARAIVVYADALHGDANLFVCGYSLADLKTYTRDVEDDAGEAALTEFVKEEDKILQADYLRYRMRARKMETQIRRLERDIGILSRRKELEASSKRLDREKRVADLGSRIAELALAGQELNGEIDGVRLRYKAIETKRKALRVLVTVLRKQKPPLKNAVTVEPCSECSPGKQAPHTCLEDILYYDIDFELFSALRQIRDDVLDEEEFIPEPLQNQSLVKMARQVKLENSAAEQRMQAALASVPD